jgi:hypothetical protein
MLATTEMPGRGRARKGRHDGLRHRLLVNGRVELAQPRAIAEGRQPLHRGVQRKTRLADPADADHRYQRRPSHRRRQLSELAHPADERAELDRQVPGEHPGRLRPGRLHLGGRGLAAGSRDKHHAHRPGQAQRISQQQRGLLAGGAADAPLQVTDRPRGQLRRLGQLFLGQPGLGPQLPQQPGERKRRLLGHGPSDPPERSATTLRTNNTQDRPAAAISTPPPQARMGQPPPAPRRGPGLSRAPPSPAAARTRPCLGRAAGRP